jgi:hypothetical protein
MIDQEYGSDQDDSTDLPELYTLPDEWYVPARKSDPDADIVISHDHEDGTRLAGSTKGDGVLEIVSRHRFEWRRGAGICIRNSRDRFADLRSIDAAAEALRDKGWRVAVEVDDVWRPAAVREEARGARVTARVERRTARATRKFAEGDRRRAGSRTIAQGIPFGQPILIGHHSEGRHRRALERIEAGYRAAFAAYDYAEHLASTAAGAEANEAAKHRPRAIMRRIETMEADRRRWLRSLEDAERCEAVNQMRRLSLEIEKVTEDIRYQRAKLGDLAESGAFVAWGPEHFQRGDLVNVGGMWCTVRRVNKKSVSVPWIVGTMSGIESDANDTVKWDRVHGRRRDGLQLDTPNGQPWPVADADRVARWARLLRLLNVGHDNTAAEIYKRIHIRHAVRVVLGLAADAADAEVRAYGEPDNTEGKRARALAMVAAYDRFAAGDKWEQVASDVQPIADTAPAWTMPDGAPEDVRADKLVPGDVIAGVYDSFAGSRRLSRSIVGPVTAPVTVDDRRESGTWVVVEVDGETLESRLSRWFSAHLVGAR